MIGTEVLIAGGLTLTPTVSPLMHEVFFSLIVLEVKKMGKAELAEGHQDRLLEQISPPTS